MTVVRANEADLEELRRLIESARYKFADFGPEDLPALLSSAIGMIGRTDGTVWGFICLQPEIRPATLPAQAPTRCYFRALALRAGYSLDKGGSQLLASALSQLLERESRQVIAYGGEAWTVNFLREAGFAVTDQVQYYELARPHRQMQRLSPPPSLARLRPAQPHLLHQLAEMDAAAFPPLWHFGHTDMLELLMRTRLIVAMLNNDADDSDNIVGYTATVANSDHELQLARLAVRPDVQGYGIGRQLLNDVLAYAASERYERVILNTQTDNARSQKLYRACGFRPVGRPIPVLTKLISAETCAPGHTA